uniref:Hypothetical sugar ABC-transporter permease n=1 Tax=Arthrobacter globiformis TaxID=1665 RepID=D2YYD9_ARTGO|nr:hypothetical sugar ABC-transporter permease [Arthrobacter globiformis]
MTSVPTRIRPAQSASGGSAPTRRRRRGDREQVVTALVFLVPALAILGVFVVYPISRRLHEPQPRGNGFDPVRSSSDSTLRPARADPAFWKQPAHHRRLTTTGVCVLSIATGLAVATAARCPPMRGRRPLTASILLPSPGGHPRSVASPPFVWKYMLDPAGFVNALLAQVGIAGPDWLQERWLALGALTALTVWKNVGFNAVLYLTALQALPPAVYEAAQLDGANAWQRLRHMTIPLLAPMTFFVVVQALITSFQAFDLVYVLTEGGPRGGTDVLGMFMYRTAFRLGDFGYGTAIAFVTLLLVLGVTLVQWRASGSGRSDR